MIKRASNKLALFYQIPPYPDIAEKEAEIACSV